ncbi:MAG: GNAT family N-acetyltransferase [Chitinophagaceae bacterium]|nr:MAG: GNAT family N-acetyltransferase [Chitinophagaceae bacterium]
MSDHITIRAYNKADKAALLELLKLNTPFHFAPEEANDFNDYLDHETELYYVVLYHDKIVGCGGINFAEAQSIGRISWDIINPQYQGKKIGTKLLKHRINVLLSLSSVKRVTVRTSQTAYTFYQKQGFETIEMIKDYWAKGFDLYRMELTKFRNIKMI